VHGGSHWAAFYTDYGVTLQKRFFDHFLKGAKTGWENQPRVQLQIRHPGEKFVERHESEWPLARTQWIKFYLSPGGRYLGTQPPEAETNIDFEALGDGVTFLTAPLRAEMEITGPSAARLFVSSTTSDADLFLVLRVFDPNGVEVVFQGALDPHTPVGQGWLRASHRKLDPALTTFYRPLSYARRRRTAAGRRDRHPRHRDMADLHRRAAGLSDRVDDSRQRLRMGRRRCHIVQHQESDEGLRTVRSRRSRDAPAGDLWRQDDIAFRRQISASHRAADHSASPVNRRHQ
jgi:hypothetical protein